MCCCAVNELSALGVRDVDEKKVGEYPEKEFPVDIDGDEEQQKGAPPTPSKTAAAAAAGNVSGCSSGSSDRKDNEHIINSPIEERKGL